MRWIHKLERKFGKYAISNLMFYVIILYGVGFLLDLMSSDFYAAYLALDIEAVLRGQVWRLITFIIQPPSTSLLFVVFTLYLYYIIGAELERAWGAFRFNLYFFTGVLFHIVAAALVYFMWGVSLPMGTYYLNMSLFFAYAALYPEQRFYLFFIIPIKVKWLAWIDAAFFGYTILQAFLPQYGGAGGYVGLIYRGWAVEAVVSLLNFLLFYTSFRKPSRRSVQEIKRRQAYQRQLHEARQQQNSYGPRHRCSVCGRTDLDDPTLEFRYCSKCNGVYEYCQDHLFTHEHIK